MKIDIYIDITVMNCRHTGLKDDHEFTRRSTATIFLNDKLPKSERSALIGYFAFAYRVTF